ncbi:MAG: MFS transporter [Canibacter sp.]
MSHSATAFNSDQRRILGLSLVPLFMSLLSVSIVNVVLPSLQNDLDASESALQWVLTGYALAFGVFLVAAGRAGDVFGRGQLFIIGVALFGVGSLVAGLAPDPLTLNIARVVMGLGSGFLNPQSIGLIQQYFAGAQRGKAFGIFGGVVGVSVAIGPVLGGVLIALFGEGIGWRTSFLVNVPFCVISILLAKPWLPKSAWKPVPPGSPSSTAPIRIVQPGDDAPKRKPQVDLDPVGTLLFACAVLLIMLPFVEQSVGSWVWFSLVLAVALFVVWVSWEKRYAKRGRAPMVDLALFQTRSFANGTLIISIFFLGATSIWVLLALYMQQGLGYSALAAGMIGLPSAITSAIAAPVSGPHVLRFGRPLVLWGIAIVLIGLLGSVLVAWMHLQFGSSIWWMLLSLGVLGVGQGLVVSPNQTLALIDVPLQYAGSAGGVLQTGQRVGTSVGIAAITGLAFSTLGATGDWSQAFILGFSVITAVIAIAGVVGIVDVVQHNRGIETLGHGHTDE